MNQGYFLNEQTIVANFSAITTAGTYAPTNGPIRIPKGAIITELIAVENTALAGGTSYQFKVDSITGTSDTNLTGAVTLASFTGLNSFMDLASTGVSATMTGKVTETGNLQLVTLGTTSAGDINVIVKFALA
jgi:hypothetical protein